MKYEKWSGVDEYGDSVWHVYRTDSDSIEKLATVNTETSATEFIRIAAGMPHARLAYLFECEHCKTTAEWTMEAVCEGGTPVCSECDQDMTLSDKHYWDGTTPLEVE